MTDRQKYKLMDMRKYKLVSVVQENGIKVTVVKERWWYRLYKKWCESYKNKDKEYKER